MNKKILAILMALLMVAMSATAFAANNNTTELIEEKTFDLTKTYTGDGKPDETFVFQATTDTAGAPALTLSDEGKINNAGTITVTVPGVGVEGGYEAKPGVYEYTIKEVAETKTAGIVYDATKYAVKVTVYNQAADGETPSYTTTISIRKDNAKQTAAAFANTYSATSMTVKKVLTGNAANLSDTFNFTVTFSNPTDGTLLKSTITGTQTAGDGVTVGTASVADNGTVTFNLSGVGHNDVVTFSNLPVGTVYSVVENNPGDYDVEYSDANADKVVAANAATNVVVTNDNTDRIDTGVFTDNMPYFMLMAFVMMLAAAVVLKKRTVNE